ncbi:MAG TPA: sigma-70 family RNA polymerase sigma factor [Desulfobulbaceae bacterium]|nr:sigma-70 family RNA polymerase sigma factor [Desulfobulbaceae bacterium]
MKISVDLTALQQGDRRQWEKFVDQSASLVAGIIHKTLLTAGHSGGETGDLLQDFYLRLCRNHFAALKRYDPERSRLSTWLAVIARNIAIDYLRRQRPVQVELDRAEQENVFHLPYGDSMEIPLASLPPRQLLVMKLLYEHDLDVRDVAKMLNIREQSVRSARHKAIVKLRTLLVTGKKNLRGDGTPPESVS